MFLQKAFSCSKDDISRLDAFVNIIFYRILRVCIYQGIQTAGVSMLMNDLISLLSTTSPVSQSSSAYTNLSFAKRKVSLLISNALNNRARTHVPGSQHCMIHLGLQRCFSHSSSQLGLPLPLPKGIKNV